MGACRQGAGGGRARFTSVTTFLFAQKKPKSLTPNTIDRLKLRLWPGLRPVARWGSTQRSRRPTNWIETGRLAAQRGQQGGQGEQQDGIRELRGIKGRGGKRTVRDGKGRVGHYPLL